MLSFVDGMVQIADVFLAIVAGLVALSLFKASHKLEHLKPWKPLISCLILFMIEEVLGALAAFNIYESAFLTHIIPSAILLLLIYALILQISEAKKWST